MDEGDRRLINALQGGFPICDRPYAEVGRRLGLDEDDVIARLERLLEGGVLSRFGPMYDAERLGGGLTLAAMAVPHDRFDEVAAIVGSSRGGAQLRAHPRAQHVVRGATERPERIGEVLGEIEAATGLAVLDLPKLEEYFLELKLSA